MRVLIKEKLDFIEYLKSAQAQEKTRRILIKEKLGFKQYPCGQDLFRTIVKVFVRHLNITNSNLIILFPLIKNSMTSNY